jgi:hypothetical protein
MTDQHRPEDRHPEDPIEAALGDAGKRLRSQAPDEVASRQALAQVNESAHGPAPRQRAWLPALIGAGLAAAAVIGVIAIRSDEPETLTPASEPTSTSAPAGAGTIGPSTTPVPITAGPGPTGVSLVVDDGCITVTTDAGSATGCPYQSTELDQLEQRTFLADLDRPVVVTSGSTDPLVDLSATADTGELNERCRWDELDWWNKLAPRIPDGGLVEVVVCNETGVMTAGTGPTAGSDWQYAYATLPTPFFPDGTDLGPGTPVPGMPRALAFTAPVDGATCSLLLLPDRSGWTETCGPAGEVTTALVAVSPRLHELSIDAARLVTSALPLEAMAPSSGCSIESASDLLHALPGSSMVTGMGCIDDKAAVTTGSVLTQIGPPDGGLWTSARENDDWILTDAGTGIETTMSFPVVPSDIWSTWPESTMPGFRSYWWEPIVAIPTQPTVDAFADELLRTLATLGFDPEFPLNERLVAVQPGGLPLIVAQVDIGGDDSVAGAMLYVWLDQQFDVTGPIGWRSSEVLAGDECARGESAGQELCI